MSYGAYDGLASRLVPRYGFIPGTQPIRLHQLDDADHRRGLDRIPHLGNVGGRICTTVRQRAEVTDISTFVQQGKLEHGLFSIHFHSHQLPPHQAIAFEDEAAWLILGVILEMRVSRSETRTSFRGLKYRSYYAKVVVNCQSQNAWYLWLSYFGIPLWKGEAIGREDYVEGKAPVLLKDIPGQPYKRIINAACKSKS